ncbi:hypothetical protein C8R44DRAFT_751738 [Mycena epipterygia]|nr:hypothetical protein C8R44DRAFT_751738 [Mycena epipterygia]
MRLVMLLPVFLASSISAVAAIDGYQTLFEHRLCANLADSSYMRSSFHEDSPQVCADECTADPSCNFFNSFDDSSETPEYTCSLFSGMPADGANPSNCGDKNTGVSISGSGGYIKQA